MEPTRLGPYVIRARIGRGGMGAVYEAEEDGSGATVAVKTLATNLGDDATVRRRFEAEIEALKALEHPGIVRLLAYGEEDGLPYFAMELVRGRSLEDVLRGGRRFTWRETLDVALEVTRALKHAHDHGVVHRDLKPANLLFADAPAPGATVKLADFGIARLFGDTGHTVAGTIVGTAEYMAPEQAAGLPTDHRADFYALGLVMFAMLAGRPPFRGTQAAEVIQRQRLEPAPRVSQLVPDVPAELDELIDRLLAKDPARRPATALALGRLLTAIDEVHATDPPPQPKAAPATPGIDLLAETAEMPPALPASARVVPSATRRDVPAAARTAQGGATVHAGGGRQRLPPTEVAPERQAVAAPPARTRFTTVEDVHRAARADADRVRRRDAVWRTLAALVTAGLLVAGGVVLFRPRSADELHARILAIAGDDDADLRDARPLIEEFLARHADDPRVAEIRALDRTLDLDALEKRARRRPLSGRELPPLERDYRAAMAREADSPAACVVLLEALLAVHGQVAPADDGNPAADRDLWLALARRQIERLRPAADRERADDVRSATAALAEAASLARQAAANPAGRGRLEARRRELLEGVVAMYASRPHAADAVAEARRLLDAQADAMSDP